MINPHPNARNRLQVERQRRGWPRKYVAEQIGVSEYTIGQWERGEHMPYPVHIQRLCDLFDSNAEDLGLTMQTVGLNEVPLQSNTARDNLTPRLTHSNRQRLLLLLAGVVVIFAIAFGVVKFVIPPHIEPGGVWVSPNPANATVGDNIHFAAYAYPTHQGDPAIDYVNFTMYWPGVDPHTWKIACAVHVPIGKDLYTCDVNLRRLGALPGQIAISFDVYDRQGNVNKAPNGVHHIEYVPS